MSIMVELESRQLSDLQQHLANLVKYYESDITALGLLGDHVFGEADTQAYAKKLMRDRMEQLSNADHLWAVLAGM